MWDSRDVVFAVPLLKTMLKQAARKEENVHEINYAC